MKTTCPDCKGPLVLLTSQNLKICADCNKHWDWKLDKGQKPIFEAPKR